MARQAQLFAHLPKPRPARDIEDHVKWYLGQRMVHVVPRSDLTGYVLRVRWSHKLGLQLDHVFVSVVAAQRKAFDIERNGFLRPVHWKRIFNPKWSRSCETSRSVN